MISHFAWTTRNTQACVRRRDARPFSFLDHFVSLFFLSLVCCVLFWVVRYSQAANQKRCLKQTKLVTLQDMPARREPRDPPRAAIQPTIGLSTALQSSNIANICSIALSVVLLWCETRGVVAIKIQAHAARWFVATLWDRAPLLRVCRERVGCFGCLIG